MIVAQVFFENILCRIGVQVYERTWHYIVGCWLVSRRVTRLPVFKTYLLLTILIQQVPTILLIIVPIFAFWIAISGIITFFKRIISFIGKSAINYCKIGATIIRTRAIISFHCSFTPFLFFYKYYTIFFRTCQ